VRRSLAARSPRNLTDSRVTLVAIKCYFDGSEAPSKSLTLAAVAGDENTWARFEGLWEEVRKSRGNPPYVHMTDLMALEGIYKQLGWGEAERDHLVDGLLNVLLSFRGAERLFCFTFSIKLADYEEVRAERGLPKPERLCARMVFPAMLKWYYEDLQGVDVGKIEAYFDRTEKFMRHVEPDWINPKIRKRHPNWELVSSITQATMEKTVALQITDVIAWGRNRLTAGSHWETDRHYPTAVRACASLHSKYSVIDKSVLATHLLGPFKEEGFAAIDPQRARQEKEMTYSQEFRRFDKMMQQLMHAPNAAVKAKLQQEQDKKKRKKSRKSSASHD
jgi:hypothetical protein